jgi:uncharacterized protein with FMN-binding domain
LRRAVYALGGTAAGIAALVAVKFHPAATTPAAGATPAPASAGTTSAPAATGKPATAGQPAPSASTGTGTSTGGGGSAQSMTARTFTGAVDNTAHGPMQVQVTIQGTKITGITILQKTNDGPESQQIDSTAIPRLTQEALAAQSANIDAVSGASYTSAGYKQSLQSALDQAGL